MRIKFGDKILEVDRVYHAGGIDRFVSVCPASSNTHYLIDCEELGYAKWLMFILLTRGYFDASGVDYSNDCNMQSLTQWETYCYEKTEEQKVFGKWVNGGRNKNDIS